MPAVPAVAVAALAFGLALLGLAGCGRAAESASLTWAGAGQNTSAFGIGVPVPSPNQPVTMGSIVVCRSGTGPDPEITDVAFVEHESDSVSISGFASRTRADGETMLGSVLGDLKNAGFAEGEVTVTTPCGVDNGPVTELGITAQSPTRTQAMAHTLRITYTSAGRSSTTDVPLSLMLCVGKTASDPCGP